jgi:threonine synthase
VYQRYGYYIDPHTAVGWNGTDKLLAEKQISAGPVAVLSTAHPAKFSETVEPITGKIPVPASLSKTMDRTVDSKTIPADISAFIEMLY